MNGCDKRNEKGCDTGYLQYVVNRCQRPMILSGEHEMDEENDGQGEHNAGEKDLDWERSNKWRSKLEVGVF